MLSVSGITKAFQGQVVLNSVDVELQRGEIALIRGDNGSGKTTLLNILTGNLEPDAGTIRLSINGKPKVFTFPQRWHRRLRTHNRFTPEVVVREGLVRSWQDTRLFGTQSLSSNIAVASPNQIGENPLAAAFCPTAVRKQEFDLQSAAQGNLDDLGLPGRGASTATHISLGQSKRVAIARAMRAGARVLLLDEPLAGLDQDGISIVLEMLRSLARDSGMTLVIVEHALNIPLILNFATTVWTLTDGRLRVEEPKSVQRDLERQNTDGVPSWLDRSVAAGSEVIEKRLLGGCLLTHILPPKVAPGQPVLEVEDLVVRRGGRLVLGQPASGDSVHGISLTIRQGEICILQAPNGWGKTTLLEAIAGLVPGSGQIRFLGQELKNGSAAWDRRKKGISLLQARRHTFPGLTVRESFRLLNVQNVPPGLETLLDRNASELSGGEKQKVAVACALSNSPRLVLLDEPHLALDAAALNNLAHDIQRHIGQSAVLIAVPGHSSFSDSFN